MNDYIKWMEKNPKWLKAVLCFFVLDWSWAIWRICKGIKNESWIQIILGILWIFCGCTVLWLLDIVFILMNDYPFWFK